MGINAKRRSEKKPNSELKVVEYVEWVSRKRRVKNCGYMSIQYVYFYWF